MSLNSVTGSYGAATPIKVHDILALLVASTPI